MSNLNRASNPSLTVQEFKQLLELEDIELYQALDLNEEASRRYIDYLQTQPETQYLPQDEFNGETLQKANTGDHLAQFLMAIQCNEQGDQAGAAQWFRKSAENGNIIAAFNYALCLSTPTEQLPWLYKAAFKGIPEAQREVGRIFYEQGDSVTARIWFGLAVRRGNAMAFNDMGVIYWHEEDSTTALEYWRQGAELGDENSIANIELATSTTLFDEDFDLDSTDNDDYTYTPPASQQPPIMESTKRTSFEIF
jgi:TPR repeat protein